MTFESQINQKVIVLFIFNIELSFIQKRDNISIFTNACRSIHIPDVLLITHSYFDSQNLDLLISGLFTFFIWVLNLYILLGYVK